MHGALTDTCPATVRRNLIENNTQTSSGTFITATKSRLEDNERESQSSEACHIQSKKRWDHCGCHVTSPPFLPSSLPPDPEPLVITLQEMTHPLPLPLQVAVATESSGSVA